MYYYIVNPAAGSGLINSIQDRLKTNLNQLKIDGEFAKTLGPGDASKITETAIAKGANTIVAVGGGETVNEIIRAVHQTGKTDVAIGIIPTGKQNWLANYLGVNSWREAPEILAARRLMEYHLMRVNDEVFVQFLNLATHLPAPETAEDSPSKWWRKILESTPQLPLSYKLAVDGNYKLRGQASLITIQNQKFLEPKLDNKLLIRLNPAHPPTTGFRLLRRLSFGQSQHFSQLHGAQLHLRMQRPAEAVLDGKSIVGKNFEVALTNHSLRLIAKSGRNN